MKKILYIDMDNVLSDFHSGLDRVLDSVKARYTGKWDEIPGIFTKMKPMPGAAKAFRSLSEIFDTYILSAAPWENPQAWADKVAWVKAHLGESANNRLILTHNKALFRGDFLISGSNDSDVESFQGTTINFDPKHSAWPEIVFWLKDEA